MEFLPTTQNGIQPPTDYFIKPSTFALALSTTTFVYTQQIEMRAYSNAQVYKRNPVTFWAYSTITNTATVISTSTWDTTTTNILFTNSIPQNTTQIYATWPGELKYAPKSTEFNPINVTVIPGYVLHQPVTISAQPNPGVINENVTLQASSTASLAITNGSRIDWYANGSNIGYSNFNQGSSVFTTTFVTTGTESIYGYWNGGILNGEAYQGTPTNTISLPINNAANLYSTFTLSSSANPSSSSLPLTLTAQLNTTTIFTGTIVAFTINTVTSTATLINNVATLSIPAHTLSTGTYTISAQWEGTSIAPKYNPITSNTIIETLQPSLNTTATVSVSPTFISYYTSTATAINNVISTNITVTGKYSNHSPSGIVTLSDSIAGVISTATISGTNGISTATISWIPTIPTFAPGSRSLQVVYPGDAYNNPSSTSTTLTINQSPAYVYLGSQGYISTGSLAGYYVGSIQVNAKFGNASVAPSTVTFHAKNGSTDVQTFTASVTNGLATITTGDFNYYGLTWSVTYPTNAYYTGTNSVTMPAKQSPNISVMVDTRQVTYNRNANPNLPPNQTPLPDYFFTDVAPNWTVQGLWDTFYNPQGVFPWFDSDSLPYPDLVTGDFTGAYIALSNEWIIFNVDKVLDVPSQYNIDQTVTIKYYQNPTNSGGITRSFIGTNVSGWDLMHTYTFTVTNAGGTIGLPKYLTLPDPPYHINASHPYHPINMSQSQGQYSVNGTYIDGSISTTTDYMTVTGPYNPVFVHGGIITRNVEDSEPSGYTGCIVDIIYSGNSILGPSFFRAYGEGGYTGIISEPPLPTGTRSTSTFIIN